MIDRSIDASSHDASIARHRRHRPRPAIAAACPHRAWRPAFDARLPTASSDASGRARPRAGSAGGSTSRRTKPNDLVERTVREVVRAVLGRRRDRGSKSVDEARRPSLVVRTGVRSICSATTPEVSDVVRRAISSRPCFSDESSIRADRFDSHALPPLLGVSRRSGRVARRRRAFRRTTAPFQRDQRGREAHCGRGRHRRSGSIDA